MEIYKHELWVLFHANVAHCIQDLYEYYSALGKLQKNSAVHGRKAVYKERTNTIVLICSQCDSVDNALPLGIP